MEEKELTNEEVIKELDEYIENGYSKTDGKIWLDHILRLQEENERLKKDVHDMSWVIKIHKYCVGVDHCQNSSAREFELQKQVKEFEDVFGNADNFARVMSDLRMSNGNRISTSKELLEWVKQKTQQAVKDAMKESLQELYDEFNRIGDEEACNEISLMAERHSVEVE